MSGGGISTDTLIEGFRDIGTETFIEGDSGFDIRKIDTGW